MVTVFLLCAKKHLPREHFIIDGALVHSAEATLTELFADHGALIIRIGLCH
jgi:hypothetical protein